MKMDRTFFKLPLLLVLFYWLFNILYTIVYVIGFDDYPLLLDMTNNQFIRYLTKQVVIYFLFQIPCSIVLFVVSIVLFNKYSIYQVNSRNITNTLLVAILFTSMEVAGRWLFYRDIFSWVGSKLNYSNSVIYSSSLTHELINFVNILISYIFITLWAYLSFKLLNKIFIRSNDVLTRSESQRLHFGLFISLYNCYFNTLIFSLLFWVPYHSLKGSIISITILALFLFMTNLIGYFLLRKCFTGVTEILNLKKLIFSSLSIFIFNCILVAIIFWVSVFLYEYLQAFYRFSNNFLLCYTWITIGMVFILSSILVRIMTKLLFDSKNKINITQ